MAVDPTETEAKTLELQAMICQALGDPKRLRILYSLGEREHSVSQLAEVLGMSVANVSQHLTVLRSRGLVRSRRERTTVFYSLAYPEIIEACQTLKELLVRQLVEGGELAKLLRRAR